MRKSLLTRLCVAFFFCAVPSLSFGYDDFNPDGLETEPGLRLQIYWIGENYNRQNVMLAVAPSASPNVDFTVPNVNISQSAVFQDNQAITDKKDEKISGQYIAQWSGWVKAKEAGNYVFKVNTSATATFKIGNLKVTDETVSLKSAWYKVSLTQVVREVAEKSISLKWARLENSSKGSSNGRFETIPTTQLRAPKFYFRPTQSGIKELALKGSRPGLGQKLISVHPGYRVTNISPGNMEMPVGGLGMLSDGRLVVARFDARGLKAPSPTEKPNGELWLISNPGSDDPQKIVGQKIVTGLYEPSGVCVINDAIYVSQRNELSKFVFNPRNRQWQRSVVAAGWKTNDFHQISAGLPWAPGPTTNHPGFLYMSRGAGLGKNQNPPNHGSVWKIDLSKPVGKNIEVLTGGHRTPNGLGLNKGGDCFVIDNQGGWTPANEINHVQKGKFYGYYQKHDPPRAYGSPFQPFAADGVTGVTEAAIKLPQDEIGNSPTQLLLFPNGHQFDGQLAVADMRYGGLNRVFMEKVNGVYQGCVMRFTQGLAAGPNRFFFGPDGSLFVGGIGGQHATTWAWHDPQRMGRRTYQGLERLTPTGKTAFEIEYVSATKDGFNVHFTDPVDPRSLADPSTYKIAQWTYRATAEYGGPKIDYKKLQAIDAAAANVDNSVALKIPGLKKGYVVHIQMDPISAAGEKIFSGDVWYTLNQIPK